MATGKGSAPSVEYRDHVAREEHQLGVRIGDVFVPFATLSHARYDQLAENEQNSRDDEESEAVRSE